MPNGFFGQNLQKSSKTEKVNTTIKFFIIRINYRRVLHFPNSLDTKFQLKLTILNFGSN